MLRTNPVRQWERFGRMDPYYGVYAVEEYRGLALDRERSSRFFASGEEHLHDLLEDVRLFFGPGFAPESVLDFGCGVGRVLIPLAKQASRAVGIDVSQSMLAHARKNCADAGVANVELLESPELGRLTPQFDFVHSALVLQHVPVREGERIFATLAGLLRPGGVGAIQVPIDAAKPLTVFNALMKLPLAHNLLNLVRGRKWSYPHMEMNVYNLSRLLAILRQRGFATVHVRLIEPFGGFGICTLYFRC